MANKRIAIVGGGASGMIAAITAARLGADVTIYERQDRVGKKLLATGNGQCNLTNLKCSLDHFHGDDPGFAAKALERFPADTTIAFFNSLGALTIAEADGKVYPRTLQASTILDVLRFELEQRNVAITPSTAIERVKQNGSVFTLQSDTSRFSSDAVIISCGSRAMPQLGGNKSGFEILAHLVHTMTDHYPVLVPIKTDCPYSRHLKGTKIQADVSVHVDDTMVARDSGELLFTEYGLSGPPIIQLSIPINKALHQKKKVRCLVDLFPDRERGELSVHVQKRLETKAGLPLETALIGFVNKRLISSLIADSGIFDPRKRCKTVTRDEMNLLAETVKNWSFAVTGSLSWNEAHVCAGGIKTDGFNRETMESLLVKSLYATGEVLDIIGDCGGYNLQWAWSSGFIAGESAAKGSA
jgi:predicted Rossmann fold flavoprotein